MYSLIRLWGLEKNPKLINVGPTSIPESRVCYWDIEDIPVAKRPWAWIRNVHLLECPPG